MFVSNISGRVWVCSHRSVNVLALEDTAVILN